MSTETRPNNPHRRPQERHMNAKERRRFEQLQELNNRKFPLSDLAIDAEDSGFDEMKLFDRAEGLIDKWGIDGEIEVISFYVHVHHEQPIPIKQTPTVDIKSTQYPDEKLKIQIRESKDRKDKIANTLHLDVLRLEPYFSIIPEEDIERNEQGYVTGYMEEQTDPSNPRKTIRRRVGVAIDRKTIQNCNFSVQRIELNLIADNDLGKLSSTMEIGRSSI